MRVWRGVSSVRSRIGIGLVAAMAAASMVAVEPVAASTVDPILGWATRAGGTGAETGVGVTVDAAGNVYTTGTFEGTVDFDPGPGVFNLTSAGDSDAFVQKLDATGDLVWATRTGSTDSDSGKEIAVDGTGNVYVIGEIKQNAANWDNRKVFNILGLLREYDAKSKGMNAGGASDGELLRELLLKIFML